MSKRLTHVVGCGLAQLAVIVVVLLGTASSAGAHATLLATEPAAEALAARGPSEVVLRFDEPVDVELGGGIRVFGPFGDRVDRVTTVVRDGGSTVAVEVDAAAPGTYTVAWRVTLASGVASAFGQVGSLEAVVSSTYGQWLIAKVAGVLLMVWLGWMNRRAVAALAVPARLSAGVRLEVLTAVAVLAVTAALVGGVPARASDGGVFAATIAEPPGTINVTVDPAAPGANVMHLYFFDNAGAPRVVDVAEAKVSVGDVPPRRITLYPITPSHFTAQSFSLPSAGLWTFTLATVSRGARTETTFEVLIR